MPNCCCLQSIITLLLSREGNSPALVLFANWGESLCDSRPAVLSCQQNISAVWSSLLPSGSGVHYLPGTPPGSLCMLIVFLPWAARRILFISSSVLEVCDNPHWRTAELLYLCRRTALPPNKVLQPAEEELLTDLFFLFLFFKENEIEIIWLGGIHAGFNVSRAAVGTRAVWGPAPHHMATPLRQTLWHPFYDPL